MTLVMCLAATFLSTAPSLNVPMQLVIIGLAYVTLLGALMRRSMPLSAPTFFLVMYGLVAATLAVLTEHSLGSAIKGTAFAALVVVAVSATDLSGPHRSARVALTWFPALVCGIALVGFAVDRPDAYLNYGGGFSRLTIPFVQTHPNTLGAIAALGLGVAIWRITQGERTVGSIAALISAVPTIVLTYSRSALLDVLVAGAVVLILLRRQLRAIALLAAPVVTAAVILGDRLVAVLARTQTTDQLADLSGRIPLWQVGLTAWLANPLFGTGYGNGANQAIHRSGVYLAYDVSTTDNVLLDALLETGVVGGLMMLLALLSALWKVLAVRRARMIRSQRRTTAISAAMVVAIVVFHGMGAGGPGRFHVLTAMLVIGVTILKVQARQRDENVSAGPVHPATVGKFEPASLCRGRSVIEEQH